MWANFEFGQLVFKESMNRMSLKLVISELKNHNLLIFNENIHFFEFVYVFS